MAAFSLTAQAVGVGSIRVESALNQLLKADIPLIDLQAEDLKTLEVKLAPQEVFDRMGMDRGLQLELLKFSIDERLDGTYSIHLSTDQPVREPYLNFLVEVNWQNGRLLREFTILLDPPAFEDEGDVSAVETAVSDAPVETIASAPPAAKVKKPDPKPQAKPAPVTKTADIETGSPAGFKAINYKVQRNDQLWRLANQLRPKNVSSAQMMLALLRENPDAFFGNNVSMLKEGAVLRIEDEDSLTTVSQQEAIAEIARQHKEWLAYQRQRQAKSAVAAESADLDLVGSDNKAAGEGAEKVDLASKWNKAKLKLVTPESDQLTEQGTPGANVKALEDELNKVRSELALATEAMEVATQENTELQKRLASLEQQLTSMQRLIQLKDQQLQKIQGGEPVKPDEVAQEPAPASLTILEDDKPVAEAENPQKPLQDESETSLLDDPLTLGTLVGLLLLVIGAGWMFSRRARSGSVESDLQKEIEEEAMRLAESESQIKQAASNSFVQDESADKLIDEQLDIDPVAEADVYIAYERYDKAIALLEQAISDSPDRHDYKLKLLEIYFQLEDREAFLDQAEQLYASLGGDESNAVWTRVRAMGQDLTPQSPLFGGDADPAPSSHGSGSMAQMSQLIVDQDSMAGLDANADTMDVADLHETPAASAFEEALSEPKQESSLALDNPDDDTLNLDETIEHLDDVGAYDIEPQHESQAASVFGENEQEQNVNSESGLGDIISELEESQSAMLDSPELQTEQSPPGEPVSDSVASVFDEELPDLEDNAPATEQLEEAFDSVSDFSASGIEEGHSELESEKVSTDELDEKQDEEVPDLELEQSVFSEVDDGTVSESGLVADELEQALTQGSDQQSPADVFSDNEGQEEQDVVDSASETGIDSDFADVSSQIDVDKEEISALDDSAILDDQISDIETIPLETDDYPEQQLDHAIAEETDAIEDDLLESGDVDPEDEMLANEEDLSETIEADDYDQLQSDDSILAATDSESRISNFEQEKRLMQDAYTALEMDSDVAENLNIPRGESSGESAIAAADAVQDDTPSDFVDEMTDGVEQGSDDVADDLLLDHDDELEMQELREIASTIEESSSEQNELLDEQLSSDADSEVIEVSGADQFDEMMAVEQEANALDSQEEASQSNEDFLVEQDVQENTALQSDELGAELEEPQSTLATDDVFAESQSEDEPTLDELPSAITEMADTDATEAQPDVVENETVFTPTESILSEIPAYPDPGSDEDSSFFLMADEVGTKLDLAKAYIEMGDVEGAKDLLTEVMDEGNEKQKREAKLLIVSSQAEDS